MKGIVKKIRFRMVAVLSALLLASPLQTLKAQDVLSDGAYTPYSLFGLGDLVRQGTAYSLSMGGIGIADRNVRYINLLNPAAVTAREAKSFMMDFGIENRNTIYQGNAATSLSETAQGVLKSASNTTTMHHIVMSLPIASRGAFKLGVMPYSHVAYNFQADETSDALISEMGDIRYAKSGTGSVNQAFIGAGVSLWRFNIGADLDYYFGKIERFSGAYFTTTTSYRTIRSGWDYNISSFGGKLGLQYTQPLSRTLSAVLGVTYTLPMQVRGNQTRFAEGLTASATDTVISQTSKMTDYRNPGELGVGISLRNADRWSMGFDYTRQDWSGLLAGSTPGVDFKAVTAQNFRGGFEITPNRYDVRSGFGHFLRRLSYRGGAYHELSYMQLNGKQVTSTGVTFGVGIPVFRYYNSINLGVDFGQRGTLGSNQIRERYFLFTVSFNLHDIWFIKPLYN